MIIFKFNLVMSSLKIATVIAPKNVTAKSISAILKNFEFVSVSVLLILVSIRLSLFHYLLKKIYMPISILYSLSH